MIPSEYKDKQNWSQNYHGVNVHRVSIIARKKGPFFRALNYISFASSAARYLKHIKTKYDITFIYQLSPVLMIYPGLQTSNRKIAYCLDIWPESVKTMHINQSNPLFYIIHQFSKKLYNRVDQVLVSSKSFIDYLNRVNDVPKSKMTYLAQHSADMRMVKSEQIKLLDDDGKFHFVFTGNIGTVQDVETIVKAAKVAKNSDRFIVDIVGSGSDYGKVQRLADTLSVKNVKFHGQQPYDLMPQYYYEADCCLLTLKNDSAVGLTLPTKLQSYMSSGRPILAAIEGDSKNVISKADCGVCVHPSSVNELAKSMDDFVCLSIEKLDKMGQNARNYYDSNFTMQIFISKLISIFEEK